MHLDHPSTHESRNICQRVLVRPYDAGKGTVGTKGCSPDRLHRHTGSDHFIRLEPNKPRLACRMFRHMLLSRRPRWRTVTSREGGGQQEHAEEEPVRRTQTASRVRMTLALIGRSVRKNDHAPHLSFTHL